MMRKKAIYLACGALTMAFGAKAQNAIDLDGVDDQIVVANASSQIANATGFSLTCWVHPTQNANWPNMEAIAGFRDNASCDFYLLQTYGTTMEGRFRNGANAVFTVDSSALLTLNTWQHVALVYGGGQLTMYHNAVPVGSIPASGTVTSTTGMFQIGNMTIPGSTQIYMDGRVDEVTLWRRGLSPEELNCIMQYGADPSDEDLRLYYRMDQGVADGNNVGLSAVTDLAGNQNGVLQGATLSGTSSNWVAGVPMSGPVSATICEGDAYVLNGEPITEAGSYVTMVQLPGGCDSLVVLDLAVTALDVSVAQNGAFLVSSQSTGPWQWVDCDDGHAPIPGATNQYYTATVSGNYAVIVQNAGCVDTSACYQVVLTSMDEASSSAVRAWYDTGGDHLVILVPPVRGPLEMGLFDATGRSVMHMGRISEGRHERVLADRPPGVYFLRSTGPEGTRVHRFVKP